MKKRDVERLLAGFDDDEDVVVMVAGHPGSKGSGRPWCSLIIQGIANFHRWGWKPNEKVSGLVGIMVHQQNAELNPDLEEKDRWYRFKDTVEAAFHTPTTQDAP